MEKYLLQKNLIYEFQSGFRQNYSTNTCLAFISDYIRSETNKGNFVGMAALDVQKAFDCVNHEILLSKLELMGLENSWFRSYLSNRNQIVNLSDTSSDPAEVQSGVPQGSILGPLLYLCYSNDMSLATDSRVIL